ncbi:MAG TPA: class I SAM-dependent methyltransferase [Gammaproteobacteria bacterium]
MPRFFIFPHKKEKHRMQGCTLCQATAGNVVSRINYIGLQTCDVVQCMNCGLISYDPIPDLEITARGCELNRILQYTRSSKSRILLGHLRSYRKGGYFARHYLQKIFNRRDRINILETGAGSGYFSQGIKKVFPNANIHYLDIVQDVVDRYKAAFECEAVAGEFSAASFRGKKFDLIIARDLIEHLSNPTEFFRDVNASLTANGYFFFITPNGRENLWESSQRYLEKDEASLDYQNHYHFYLPETLDRLLDIAGFEKKIFFKWGLKRHRRGLGHRRITSFPPIQLPDTGLLANKQLLTEYTDHDKNDVFNSWLHGNGLFSSIYSRIVDRLKERVDYYDFKGHEFFVLAGKTREAAAGRL